MKTALFSLEPKHSLCYMAFLLLVAISSGCSHHLLKRGQYSVLYARQQRLALPPDGSTVRVYIDRMGDLYPDLPTQFPLRDGFIKGRKSILYNYYRNQPHGIEATGKVNNLGELAHAYGIDYDKQLTQRDTLKSDTLIWCQVQQKLVQRHIQMLNAKLRTVDGMRPLVILIHGFNVGSDAHIVHGQQVGLYTQVRTAFNQIAPDKFRNAVFLEVFWDGLQKPTPVGIWGGAQLNARYAGLRLRQLIAGVDIATPVRVFTHSSGAIVATHTFWNVNAPYPNRTSRINTRINELYKNRATPLHPDVRLGLLVPATPGLAFTDHDRRTQPSWYLIQQNLVNAGRLDASLVPIAVPDRRTIVGLNERDYALNKAGIVSPYRKGVTSLGCVPADFRYVLDCVPGTEKEDLVAFWHADPKNKKRPLVAETTGFNHARFEAHGWQTYLLPERRQNFIRFVSKVMD
jgi:hypothetical protein